MFICTVSPELDAKIVNENFSLGHLFMSGLKIEPKTVFVSLARTCLFPKFVGGSQQ